DFDQCMLHPVDVIAFGKVLACVPATGFCTLCCRVHGADCLSQQVGQLIGFDQVAVPDQRTICHPDIGQPCVDLIDSSATLRQCVGGTKNSCVGLHGLLHL